MILSANSISKTFDKQTVLTDVTFHIEAHDKLAVIGPNGCGKSTLLRIIVGEEHADEGSIVIPKDTQLAYLAQNPDISSDRTIYEEVLSSKAHLIQMEEELRSMEKSMQSLGEDDPDTHQLYERYSALSHRFEIEGGYSVKSNVVGVLKGLGFTEHDFDRRVSVLSGGEKTRLMLGKLLISEPDILLLDEPTNHLDISAVAWLENYLRAFKQTVIIVSHDRYFLDKVANKVLDIENTRARLYNGNYTEAAEKKAALRKEAMRAYLNNQAEIKHQQEVITKLKQFNREKSIKRAESREKMLAKIDRVEKPFNVDDAIRLRFSPAHVSGNDVLKASGLSKSFGERNLFSGVDLDVKRGEKLAIIGPNGTGKTTLLKIICGTENADSGEIDFGSRVETAYYDQEHHVLDPDNSVFEEISDDYPAMSNTEIRSLLAAFLFTGDDVFKMVRDLSGGEKGRLSLSKLMLSNANLLLLDEPTNHLDITSKEILEEAVRNYEGTVIYVSHDRYFINRTATRILELDNRSFVNYLGNYDYYLEKKADPEFDASRAISGTAASPAASPAPSVSASASASNAGAEKLKAYIQTEESRSKLSYQEQKERKAKLQKLKSQLSECEKNIQKLEQKDFETDELMSHPEIAVNSAKLNELSKEKEAIAGQLSALYDSWAELSEMIENFDRDNP